MEGVQQEEAGAQSLDRTKISRENLALCLIVFIFVVNFLLWQVITLSHLHGVRKGFKLYIYIYTYNILQSI